MSQRDLDKLVMNYLAVNAFPDLETFAAESGLALPITKQQLERRVGVLEALGAGDADSAGKRLAEAAPKILESEDVQFKLAKLKVQELVREGKVDEALEIATGRLAELAAKNTDYLRELEDVMVLLAFPSSEETPDAVKETLQSKQHEMVDAMNEQMLAQQGFDAEPTLLTACKMLKHYQGIAQKHARFPTIEQFGPEMELKADTNNPRFLRHMAAMGSDTAGSQTSRDYDDRDFEDPSSDYNEGD